MTWALETLAWLAVMHVLFVRCWSEALQHCAFATALDADSGLEGFPGSKNNCTCVRSVWMRIVGGHCASRMRLDMLSAGTEEAVQKNLNWWCTSKLQLMPLVCTVQDYVDVLHQRPCGHAASKYLPEVTRTAAQGVRCSSQ